MKFKSKTISFFMVFIMILGMVGYDNVTESTLIAEASVRTISDNGINLIKSFEGFRDTAYKALPSEKYYTIGYGHYGADVYDGMRIDEQKAVEFLRNDMSIHLGYLNSFLDSNNIQVNQNQYDALASFTFNLGNVWVSTPVFKLKTYLIQGIDKYSADEITTAFTNWCKDGAGNTIQGLITRRKREAELFLSGQIVSGCNCSESYKGYYVVSTNSLPLTMRSGHGSNYSQITTIPKGTVVYVSKADGAWAHVEWNGLCGYCSMQYLTRNVEAPTIYAWVSETQMGNNIKETYKGKWVYLCYELKETGSGALFNSVAPGERYQVTETFYDQTGNVVFTNTYGNSDSSWICQSLEPGKYKGVVTVSGEYEGSCTVEFEVKDISALIDYWSSYEKFGKDNSIFNVGETCYVNCKMYDEYSGKQITEIYNDRDFEISHSLYSPSGKCVYSNTYKNSSLESFNIKLEESGNYTIKTTVSVGGRTMECAPLIITVNKNVTPTPIITRKPTSTPIITRKPTSTPIVTRKPTQTPSVTINPTQTPLPTTDATLAPTATIQPSNETATTDENTADDQEELWYSELEEGDVFEVGNGYYEITDLEDGNGEVTYLSPISMKNQSEVIPASVVYEDIKFKVTAIDEGAFKKHKTLTSVTIGANIQRIGAYAFYKAKKLETITIKSSKITKMGKKSFCGLKSKIKVKLPSKVKGKYKKMLTKAGLSIK